MLESLQPLGDLLSKQRALQHRRANELNARRVDYSTLDYIETELADVGEHLAIYEAADAALEDGDIAILTLNALLAGTAQLHRRIA